MIRVTRHKENLFSITLNIDDLLTTKFFNSREEAIIYHNKLRRSNTKQDVNQSLGKVNVKK